MKYQDLVIKDEKFVGKFEEMYQKFSDPWNLLKINKQGFNLNYQIIYNYCEQVRSSKKLVTLEIGCGFPQPIPYCKRFFKRWKRFKTHIIFKYFHFPPRMCDTRWWALLMGYLDI